MKYRKSIVTEHHAASILKKVRDAQHADHLGMFRHVEMSGVIIDLRLCRYNSDGREQSGGIVIKARLDNKWAHGSYKTGTLIVRLSNGWTDERLRGVVRRIWFWSMSERRTLEAREALYKRTLEMEQSDLDALESEVEAAGLPVCFSDMTCEDVGKISRMIGV